MSRKKEKEGPVSEVLEGPPQDPLPEMNKLRGGAAVAEPSVPSSDMIHAVPIGDIYPWDVCEAVRQDVDGDALMALKANIAEHGIKTPLWACPADGGGWLLIAGYRRLRAARELGIATVPVISKHVADPNDAKLLAVLENTAREDLGEMDAFRAIDWVRKLYPNRVLHTETGERAKGKLNVSAIAAMMGRGSNWARTHCRTMETFTLPELEEIAKTIERQRVENTPMAARLTWGRVLYAATDAEAGGWRDTILQMVKGQTPEEAAGPEATPPAKSSRSPVKERYVPVKCDLLVGAAMDVRFGSTKNRGAETVTIRATVEIPGFKIGKTSFTSGEKGASKTSLLFEEIGNAFLALARHGDDPKDSTEEAVNARLALREALDHAVAKLAHKLEA
mgnify:CR=1 FL=1